MEDIIQCVRCGTRVPRPADRRARCATCGTALPLFADDPALPVPPLPVPDAARRLPPMPAPSGPDRFQGSELSPDAFPPPADGYEDFRLDDEPAPAPARVAAPPPPPPAEAARPARAAPTFQSARTGRSRLPLVLGAAAAVAMGGAALLVRGGADTPAPPTTPAAPAEVPALVPPAPHPVLPAAIERPAAAPAPAQPRPAPRPRSERPIVATAAPLEVRASDAEAAAAAAGPTPTPAPAAGPPPAATPAASAPARPAASSADIPLPPPPPGMELVRDAPAYPADGFKKPRLAEPGCVQSSLRLPRDAFGLEGETATIRFAVGPDGAPSHFQLMAGPADPRVASAIWAAVQRCAFEPGTDAQGRPALLWLVMPLRFTR